MKSDLTLGQKIRNFRKRADMSQFELENEIEAAPGSLSRIENGEVNPTKQTLIKIIEILDLRTYEAASLFNLDTEELPRMVLIAKELSSSLDLNKVLQNAVNLITYELNLLGTVIFLKAGNKVQVESVTQSWFTELVFKLLPLPISKLAFDIDKDKESIVVKTILEKRSFYTLEVNDISTGLISKRLSNIIQKTTGQKSAITLPMIVDDQAVGAILFAKIYLDDFKNEMTILKAFTEHVTTAIVNAQKFERLQEEINKIKKSSNER